MLSTVLRSAHHVLWYNKTDAMHTKVQIVRENEHGIVFRARWVVLSTRVAIGVTMQQLTYGFYIYFHDFPSRLIGVQISEQSDPKQKSWPL